MGKKKRGRDREREKERNEGNSTIERFIYFISSRRKNIIFKNF